MSDRLQGKVAVVTGSGQGIGKAIALAMAREGARVATNNRCPGSSGGDAATTAQEIIDLGGQAVPFFGDVSDFEVARQLIQTAVDSFGRLDILVNNAGILAPQLIWNMTEEEWDSCVDSHLKGAFNCTRHACGLMKEQRWGRIINATSTAWLGTQEMCNYGAAKAGIVGLTRAVAREMSRYGVTCNAYAATAATRMLLNEDMRALFKRSYEAGFYNKQFCEMLFNPPSPETAAPLIVYLSTDEAANINGRVFRVVGGHIGIYSEPVEKKAIFKKEGSWTVEELIELVPKIFL